MATEGGQQGRDGEDGPPPGPAALAEQLDEVQLLEAMVGREGEFEWRQEERGGRISGRLQVFLQLDGELNVRVTRRERRHTTGVSVSTASNEKSKSSEPDLLPSSSPTSCSARATPTKVNRECSKSAPPPLQSIRVAHLPPISLHFDLPAEYPQHDEPWFTLSCKWLNFTQLTTLCQHLDSLWLSDPGSVVLYNWQQFLATESLSTLNFTSELVLQFEDPTKFDDRRDKRAIQDMEHPSLLLPFLLDYDKREREREFSESFFDCEICFLSLPGSKCKRLEACGHTHCRECLTLHVMAKIGSGDVIKISCPSGSCEESLPLSLIRELVSPDIFERFDRLLLQRTLDGMMDVVYCPRPTCQCVTLREEDGSNMAQCPRCRFSFCILCKHVWHGLSPCKLISHDLKVLRQTWEGLDPAERAQLQLQYGKAKLESAFQEFDSQEWIDSNAHNCPQCRAKIQKALGCNKMTCTHCNSNFCWLCDQVLARVDPYKHFRLGQSACAGKLFEGITDIDDDFW